MATQPFPPDLDPGAHAFACLLLSKIAGVDVLARYVLPLAYREWIGLAALALAGVAVVALAMRTGPSSASCGAAPPRPRVRAGRFGGPWVTVSPR